MRVLKNIFFYEYSLFSVAVPVVGRPKVIRVLCFFFRVVRTAMMTYLQYSSDNRTQLGIAIKRTSVTVTPVSVTIAYSDSCLIPKMTF